MKIRIRDVSILGFGFVLGMIFTATLPMPKSQPPSIPRVAANQIALVSFSPTGTTNVTHLQWKSAPAPGPGLSPDKTVMDPLNPAYLPILERIDMLKNTVTDPQYRPNVDLIDTHYKPDVRVK